MITALRGKLGQWIVTGIIALIALIFAFEGFFARGLRSAGVGNSAGTVNGDVILIGEFNRVLKQELERAKAMFGGGISDEQLLKLGIKQAAFRDLVQRRLQIQAANRQGLVVSDEELKTEVSKIPVFQKDGHFDPLTYREILSANRLNPGQFEKSVREDLLVQKFSRSFLNQILVTETDARAYFEDSQNTRSIAYFSILEKATPREAPSLNLSGTPAKTPSASVGGVPQKSADVLANEISHFWDGSKKQNERVDALLKPYAEHVEVKENVTAGKIKIPSLSDDPEFLSAIFKTTPPLKKPVVYKKAGRIFMVVVTEAKKPKPTDFSTRQKEMANSVKNERAQSILSNWLEQEEKKSKITQNENVFRDPTEAAL